MNNIFNTNEYGFGLIEVIFAAAIIGTSIVALFGVFASLTGITLRNTDELRANFLMEEGVEVVHYLRNTGWDSTIDAYSLDTDYRLVFSGGEWTLSTTPQVFIDDTFDRTVRFSSVYRNGSDVISDSGTLDSGMRFAEVSVSWMEGGATTTRTLGAYFADIYGE